MGHIGQAEGGVQRAHIAARQLGVRDPRSLPLAGRQRRRLWLGAGGLLLGSLGLAGCGGGASDDPGASPSDADPVRLPLGGVDSSGTGAAMASFVSADVGLSWPLTVNGVTYDTTDCRIVDADDRPLDALALLPGMSCQILATGPRGRATIAQARSIRMRDQLLAPITNITLATGRLSALGQTVVITGGTVVDAALVGGFAALRAGQQVQVWGQLDSAGGRIVATRLGLAPAAEAWVVRGVLSGLDRASASIRIGGLRAAAAAGGAALIPADLQLGDVVRARLSADGLGTLLSLRGDALQLPDRVEAELEGRITRIDGPRRFAVDGVTVDASAASLAAGAALLALGARAVVHGRSVQGQLRATTVRVEPDEPVELECVVSAADALRQTFVLKGLTVAWSATTVFEGGSARLLRARRRAAVIGRWNPDRSVLEASHIHVEA